VGTSGARRVVVVMVVAPPPTTHGTPPGFTPHVANFGRFPGYGRGNLPKFAPGGAGGGGRGARADAGRRELSAGGDDHHGDIAVGVGPVTLVAGVGGGDRRPQFGLLGGRSGAG